jgi:CDP-diacylglycerol--serine O-phosphatidyltransferase
VLAFNQQLAWASAAILAAALFDFADGLAARALRAYSAMGKELDSLADMVSFGVLPACIVYQLLLQGPQLPGISPWLNWVAFLIPVFSGWRLAKFNTDDRQQEIFYGLPTPANAIFTASLPLILLQQGKFAHQLVLNPYALSAYVVCICLLMVVDLPLLSLKFKNTSLADNIYRYLLLLLAAILIVIFKFAAIPAIIVLYVALSIIQFRLSK